MINENILKELTYRSDSGKLTKIRGVIADSDNLSEIKELVVGGLGERSYKYKIVESEETFFEFVDDNDHPFRNRVEVGDCLYIMAQVPDFRVIGKDRVNEHILEVACA